jgi:hypothetical protein
MALAAYDVHFHLSGAASLLGAQPDPNASLGNYIASASDRLYHTQGTASAVGSNSSFSSASFTGQDFTGDWVLAITGAAVGLAAKVVAMAGGVAQLDRPLAGIAIGDYFRVHSPDNLFDDVDAAEALAGDIEFRGIFARNETGVALAAVRLHLEPLFASPTVLALAAKDGMASQFVGGLLPDEGTAPNLATTLGDANARFESIFDHGIAYDVGSPASINNSNQRPLWLRRAVSANSGPQVDTAWMVVLEGSNPIWSAALIVFSGAGFTPQIAMQEDRYAYVGGGARVTTTITDEGGTPQEEYDLEWSVVGDGTLDAATGQTDEDGQDTAAYTAPSNESAEGQSASVVAKVI